MPLCAENIVKAEDYFNTGVLVMNLERLRNEQDKLLEGTIFIAENPKYNVSMDQDILNYCFSKEILKLPFDYNVQVAHSRGRNDFRVEDRICHYISGYKGIGVTMNLSDNFNKLYWKFFAKTPWFNEEIIGRIYEGVQNIYVEQKAFATYVSAMMSGKSRAFYISQQNLEGARQIFGIREDEEIILSNANESVKKVIKSLRKSRRTKVFFLLTESPEILQAVGMELVNNGFTENKDFINAMNFLSDAHGVPFNSYQLVKLM